MSALTAVLLALPVAFPGPAGDDPAAGAPRPSGVSLTLAPGAQGEWAFTAGPSSENFDWNVNRGGAGSGSGLSFTFNLAAFGRYSIPTGAIENRDAYFVDIGVIVIPDHLRYNDLFGSSLGFNLEVDLTLDPSGRFDSPRYARDLVIGGYASVGADFLQGDKRMRDDVGNFIVSDDMDIYTATVGFKAAQSMGEGILGEMRVGIGAAYSPAVKGTFGSLALPDGQTGELFAESWQFVFESKIHAGYRVGPLAIVAGVGGRILTGPREGDGIRQGSLDPKILFLIDFELGAEIGF
jgi:hypothetical protein